MDGRKCSLIVRGMMGRCGVLYMMNGKRDLEFDLEPRHSTGFPEENVQ